MRFVDGANLEALRRFAKEFFAWKSEMNKLVSRCASRRNRRDKLPNICYTVR